MTQELVTQVHRTWGRSEISNPLLSSDLELGSQPGWNAYLEVWGEIQGLYCKVWKFWVHCDVNKNPGTKALAIGTVAAGVFLPALLRTAIFSFVFPDNVLIKRFATMR
ncbi:hypothetical protein F2Q69_00042650 [Brassica cretica]|uniref:Uncharacterized protein n=1 Tax=Brassica cretica TaxID=69181 RepID=A0A8S9NH46_BRACR|nr:hypothetical protein F2Q69_00042650 [Brassica cretica]